MIKLDSSRKRTRVGLAAATLAVSTTGVLTLASPASALPPPEPVQAPENAVTTAIDYDTLRVQWTRPSFGAEPTYYRVIVDPQPFDPDFGGPLPIIDPPPTNTFVGTHASPAYSTEIAVQNRGQITFDVWVCANDEVSEACTGPMTVTTPAAPLPPITDVIAPGPYSPFWTVDAFIRQNYLDWLDREVRFDELSFWRTTINNGRVQLSPEWERWYARNPYACETIDSIDDDDVWPSSGDYDRIADNKVRFLENLRHEPSGDALLGPVTRLYIATYLRNPDYNGLGYWHGRLIGGGDIRDVAQYFTTLPEFTNRYGNTFDDAEFVALMYRNVLGRNPDSAGFAYWTRQLQTGRTWGSMLLGFSESPEFRQKTERAVISTEVYYAMLKRVPTAAEYDAITRLPQCVDTDIPTDPGFGDADMTWVHYIYLQMVMNSAEYRGRIDTGLVL